MSYVEKFSHWVVCRLGFHYPVNSFIKFWDNKIEQGMPYHHCRYCKTMLWYYGEKVSND